MCSREIYIDAEDKNMIGLPIKIELANFNPFCDKFSNMHYLLADVKQYYLKCITMCDKHIGIHAARNCLVRSRIYGDKRKYWNLNNVRRQRAYVL